MQDFEAGRIVELAVARIIDTQPPIRNIESLSRGGMGRGAALSGFLDGFVELLLEASGLQVFQLRGMDSPVFEVDEQARRCGLTGYAGFLSTFPLRLVRTGPGPKNLCPTCSTFTRFIQCVEQLGKEIGGFVGYGLSSISLSR